MTSMKQVNNTSEKDSGGNSFLNIMVIRDMSQRTGGNFTVLLGCGDRAVPFEFLDESTQPQSIHYLHCLWIQLSLASRFNSSWIPITNPFQE